MSRVTTAFLFIVGTSQFFAPSLQSQSPDEPTNAAPPPVLSAIDTNRDGEISADELANAPTALKGLDRNDDGRVADAELTPARDGRQRRVGDGGPRGGFSPFRGLGRGGFNPFGGGGGSTEQVPPEKIEFKDGVASIPDHDTFHRLSYRGEEVLIDTYLADLEFVKFTLDKPTDEDQQLYFINTKTHRAHMMFARVAGLPFGRGDEQMKGVLVYHPMLKSPNGQSGLYTFEFEPFDAYSFEMVQACHEALTAKMPSLKGRVGYYPRFGRAIARAEQEEKRYSQARIPFYLESDLDTSDVGYLPLNPGATFGRLRIMELGERPSPRDVVLYESLPNEMPRVAGIITSVRQTPLSHVNLRAIQDRVPNSFIVNAADDPAIAPLVGKFVSYVVTPDGFRIREADADEVDAHLAAIRPTKEQVPPRDLGVKRIRPLSAVRFEDSSSVGVKAANLAALHTFGLAEGVVPEGFAIPFYFYDEFMKYNGFYDEARALLDGPDFQRDRDTRVAELKAFRSRIKKGRMPDWMMDALDELHESFPEGSSVRCRSSTNNEDLPGFSGAGLYDSYTHKPDEGHFSKSVKQVYASLWNFRAFEEREFYRVDHLAAAMGVLVHPNFKGERANGVAVTDDILYQTDGNYYVNTQVGEDLVTNPEEASIPEEMLLDWWNGDVQVMRTSNRSDGKRLLSDEHTEQLRKYLGRVHARFAKLYEKPLDSERFAMEIEFKITADGRLVVKQARPWVYAPTGLRAGARDGAFDPASFRMMKALDANGDGVLSAREMDNAVTSLRKLDEDTDGKLSGTELGWPPAAVD